MVVSHLRANPLRVVLHELGHAVLGDALEDSAHTRLAHAHWPVWLEEGLAEYASACADDPVAGLRFGAVHAARLATVADALARGGEASLSLEDLLRAPISRFAGARMHTSYAHAWALTHLLMTTPDLADRLPGYLARVRGGEDGYHAFLAVYGADLAGLARKLEGHVIALSNRPQRAERWLSERGAAALELMEWTRHARGSWEVDPGGGVEGRTRGGYDYLTRAVGPLFDFTLDVEIRRDDPGGTPGIVLGYHGVDGYPYHTLIDFGPAGVEVRSAASASRLDLLERSDGVLATRKWEPVRLLVSDGILIAWQGDRHLLTTRLPGRAVSLVGLYLHGGRAAFRKVEVRPQPHRSADATRH
jgi:hypothetical protein